MQKKSWLIPIGLLMALIISILVAGTPGPEAPADTEDNNTVCCKSQQQECRELPRQNAPGELIYESLSRQFMAIPVF